MLTRSTLLDYSRGGIDIYVALHGFFRFLFCNLSGMLDIPHCEIVKGNFEPSLRILFLIKD